jgi:putative transposase
MDSSKDKLFKKKYKTVSSRLKGYDYSLPGWYFITICTYRHKCLFGKIIEDDMMLNELGITVKDELFKSEVFRKEIEIHEYIIMPNHIHILAGIDYKNYNGKESVENSGVAFKIKKSIGMFVRGFKSAVTRNVDKKLDCKIKLWQSGYYDHIVRNEKSLEKIKSYIINNPICWSKDKYYI